MVIILLLLGIVLTFFNLLTGIVFGVLSLVVSIIGIKNYKEKSKFFLVIAIILLIFQLYLVIKKNGELNGAKQVNAKSTINYLVRSAELYYMDYFTETGHDLEKRVIFQCNGKKCYNGDIKLDIVGTVPQRGFIIIDPGSNGIPKITGHDIVIFDLTCTFDEYVEIKCIQK